jgi:hypothetical protein
MQVENFLQIFKCRLGYNFFCSSFYLFFSIGVSTFAVTKVILHTVYAILSSCVDFLGMDCGSDSDWIYYLLSEKYEMEYVHIC